MQAEKNAWEIQNKLSKKHKKIIAKFKYFLSEDELIARSFAQYKAEKSQGILLEELKNDAIVNKSKYFQSISSDIEKKYDELLKTAGL